MTYDFQVEFFSFNYQKQWKLSVCKKVINQVRVNGHLKVRHYLFVIKGRGGVLQISQRTLTDKSCEAF